MSSCQLIFRARNTKDFVILSACLKSGSEHQQGGKLNFQLGQVIGRIASPFLVLQISSAKKGNELKMRVANWKNGERKKVKIENVEQNHVLR